MKLETFVLKTLQKLHNKDLSVMEAFEQLSERLSDDFIDLDVVNRKFNIKCVTSLNIEKCPHAGGTTNLNVVGVEIEDDDSVTVITDYWPH